MDDSYQAKFIVWRSALMAKYGVDTRDSSEWFERVAMQTTGCPKCSAEPGKPCRLPSGRKLKVPHAGRVNELQAYPDRWYDAYLAWSDRLWAF